MLEKDSWFLHRQKWSHRQFKHSDKKGTVTVNGKPSEVLSQMLLKYFQASCLEIIKNGTVEKIKVIIDWDENFGAVSDLVEGCFATGKTFDQIKENYASTLKFHLEGLEKWEIPKEFSRKYEL
ncbi:type II toxin-antitoxin system HicA family toxin [Chryseobacterium sp. MP_3.2]|uniref:type II toxin-antitoxin system HicA family toxin n=1 Tax=Chryseobacterium sp. MP_3.2 TaxID=3071712 RepID=UPI002DF96580|nr:putative RNA binding protein YcfA (HicA-like mRNA interferase family)/putative RNase H-like HicB family nuclease [Chryseobacterium sp. MP_3.2]